MLTSMLGSMYTTVPCIVLKKKFISPLLSCRDVSRHWFVLYVKFICKNLLDEYGSKMSELSKWCNK